MALGYIQADRVEAIGLHPFSTGDSRRHDEQELQPAAIVHLTDTAIGPISSGSGWKRYHQMIVRAERGAQIARDIRQGRNGFGYPRRPVV